MSDEYKNNFVVLTDEEGNEKEFEHIDTLEDFLKDHHVDVVALTIPQSVAQETADWLIGLGIQGFWNFTNIELVSNRPEVKFENIHFADSLLTLSYRISNQ